MYSNFEQNAHEVSTYLKLLSHEGRLKLICLLLDGEKNVSELIRLSSMSQSQISQYLKQFEISGIVESQKDGKWTNYKIKSKTTIKLLKSLNNIFC